MASFVVISYLKQGAIPKKKFRALLSYLPQDCLKEYLDYFAIYHGKRNRSKFDLIEMIIVEKLENLIDKGSDCTREEALAIIYGNVNSTNKPIVMNKPVNK